jgi:hypothetical protein
MFDFTLSRTDGPTVFHLSGSILGADDAELVNEAFAFIPPDDHLIIDLNDLDALDAGAARMIHDLLQCRGSIAENVVMSSREAVSMQLVLHDVDRVCPIVASFEHARAILGQPWAQAPR